MLKKIFKINLKICRAALFFTFFLPLSSLFAEEELSPTVEVSFEKQPGGNVYTIIFGKRTKFNDHENAPYKFLFLDETKGEISNIPKDFFKKNREGTVKYNSDGKESFVKFTIPVCLYDKNSGKAQKCTVVGKTLTVK